MYLQNSGDFICSDHMKHKRQQFYMPQEQEVYMQEIMAELIWLLTTHI
jgi:hypothetical protein